MEISLLMANGTLINHNRKPPKAGLDIPQTYLSAPDLITNEVLKVVDKSFPDHFGDLYPFNFAVTREQALEALEALEAGDCRILVHIKMRW